MTRNLLRAASVGRPAGGVATVPIVLFLTACAGVNYSEAQSVGAPVMACEALANKIFFNVQVTSAVAVAASGGVPGYCRVRGTESETQHDIEVRLPDAWRERYVQEGGGGFDGSIRPVDGTDVVLSLGAVQTANNGGHRDRSGADFLNNPLVVQRYAQGAILTATLFGKAVTKAYYGHAPQYSYYEGCSNGGRGALNAAAKYGDEFDGVIAGAPTINLTGQIEEWTRASALTLPNAAKLVAVNAAAVAKCDALDGAKDGIISNWGACKFDPTLDVPASVGLTAGEAAAVKFLMTELKLADGTTIYSGYGFGDMSRAAPGYAVLGVGHIQNVVLNDTTWKPTSFNVDTFYPTISNVIDKKYSFSASASGLAQFLTSGKKIIAWQGSDDALLSAKDTIRTWQDVTGAAGATATSANSRLYIAAGVNHCTGGPGADTFDLLTPLMTWVEKGVAPETILSSKASGDTTLFTRPLCVYPGFPKYRGTGDIKDAANFECATK